MTERRHIRITLTREDQRVFDAAKEKAEDATDIAMSDSMFALSVIRQALKKRKGSGD